MRIIIIISILIITSCTSAKIKDKNKEINYKKSDIFKKLNLKGYKIEAYLKRPKGFGSNCEAHIMVINDDSSENEFYIEVQAMDEENVIISVVNFLILKAPKNETIIKSNVFNEIKSCSHIKNLNIIAG